MQMVDRRGEAAGHVGGPGWVVVYRQYVQLVTAGRPPAVTAEGRGVNLVVGGGQQVGRGGERLMVRPLLEQVGLAPGVAGARPTLKLEFPSGTGHSYRSGKGGGGCAAGGGGKDLIIYIIQYTVLVQYIKRTGQ